MNADGSNTTRLTNDAFIDSTPSFRPDGRKIVFFSSRTGSDQIFTMNPDGSNPMQITHNALDDAQPSYSPDGQWIVFVANKGVDQDIYRMTANGADILDLSNDPGSNKDFPRFSPNGSKIAYERSDSSGTTQVYLMNSEGSSQTQLTSIGNNYVPSFSPDGKKIIFDSDRDGNEQIYMMGVNGSNQTRITTTTTTTGFLSSVPSGPKSYSTQTEQEISISSR